MRRMKMKYRKMGKTGIEISALGFGCMRLPEYEKDGKWYIDNDLAIPMLRKAYEYGVNYFDTAYYYCHSNSERTLGQAVKPFRYKVYLSTKIPLEEVHSKEDFWGLLKTSLARLDTDYIDFYHFWALNKNRFDEVVLKYGLIDEAMEAKRQGLIRHLSFSFHDDPKVIKYIIDTGKVFSSMLVQYNLLDRKNEEMINYAHDQGLGVVIMGPVGGGRLASPENALGEKLNLGSIATYELAFKFVLSNPNVTCALSGMENLAVLKKNVQVINNFTSLTTEEQANLQQALTELQKFSELYCTGCKYCNGCPQSIKIDQIFGLYTYYNVYGLTDFAKQAYARYLKNQNVGQIETCLECGLCESKCPQKLPIIEDLKKVDRVLRT
jgi:predicted aldo/keto reductase-like oxidoreductase